MCILTKVPPSPVLFRDNALRTKADVQTLLSRGLETEAFGESVPNETILGAVKRLRDEERRERELQ